MGTAPVSHLGPTLWQGQQVVCPNSIGVGLQTNSINVNTKCPTPVEIEGLKRLASGITRVGDLIIFLSAPGL